MQRFRKDQNDDVDRSDDPFWNESDPGAAAGGGNIFREEEGISQTAEALRKLKMMEPLYSGNVGDNQHEESVETVEWTGEKVTFSGGNSSDSRGLISQTASHRPNFAGPSPVASRMNSDSGLTPSSRSTGYQKNPSIGSVGAASSVSSSSFSIDNAVRSRTPKKEFSQVDYSRLDDEYKKLRKKFEQLNRERCRPGEVTDTVQRMIDGKPFVLEYHRKLEEKVRLLDSVLQLGDGDLILKVVLFLKTSLSYALFQDQLLKKPVAANHYIAYLKESCLFEDLKTALLSLGRKEEASMVEFQLACKKSLAEDKVASLKRWYQGVFGADTSLSNECQLVAEYVDLLERQLPIDSADDRVVQEGRDPKFKQFPKMATVIDQSMLTTLYYCCLYHYDLPVNSFASALSLRGHHKLSDKQFAWIAVRALAKQSRWPDIQKILTSKSLFGGSKIKSPIPVDKLLVVLANAGASPETLSIYLRSNDDFDRRLQLATKYKCHEVVVDCLVAAKDRLKLIEYGAKLTNSSKEAYYFEAALRNSANKWKN